MGKVLLGPEQFRELRFCSSSVTLAVLERIMRYGRLAQVLTLSQGQNFRINLDMD